MRGIEEPIGIVGFGTIGREICKAITEQSLKGFCLVGVMDINCPESLPDGCVWTDNIDDLIKLGPKLIIESASVEAFCTIAEIVLKSGIELMALSVAALADRVYEMHIKKLAEESGSCLLIPSGAIGCLDVISAGSTNKLSKIILTQRKPPKAIMPEKEANQLNSERIIFEGSAREAALKFPKTSNIAATLGFSGPGLDSVIVRVVTDPKICRNSLELEAEGEFGKLRLELQNNPSQNLRTSKLAYMSIISVLKRRAANFVCPA